VIESIDRPFVKNGLRGAQGQFCRDRKSRSGGAGRAPSCAICLGVLMLAPALRAQSSTCTVSDASDCPTSGSPTAGDQFGDTVSWTSSPSNVFAAPNGGEDFQDFLSGAGTALAQDPGAHPRTNIVFSAEFIPFEQTFFLSDPAGCPAAGPPTCLYNNVPYAEAFADALFKAPSEGLGLRGVDINIDPGPWFTSTQYASYCAAYSSSTVPQGTACFKPTPEYQSSLTSSLGTYLTVLSYVNKTYPNVRIHFSPTPSADIWSTCGLTNAAGRTEAALEACMVPLYQSIVATVNTDRFTALHEAAGVWAIYCQSCPFLANPSNVDTFLQNASLAIKAVSPSTSVGVGGAYSEMGIAGGEYICPNTGSSLNYWCDYTTIDSFLDYVGMDIYPSSSGPSSGYASLMGADTSADSTYQFMAQRVVQAPYGLALYGNESSALRWSPPGGAVGSGETDTYLGSGWIGWSTTDTWSQWLNSAADWAQSMGMRAWDYFDGTVLLCLSSDPNNTHNSPDTDGYLPACMAAIGSGAPATSMPETGTAYSAMAQSTAPPFTVRLSTAGQGEPFAPEVILAAYGTNLATGTSTASVVPLPTSLNGNSVTVTDSTGTSRPASLFYVSPSQVNFELPENTASGLASLSIQNQNGNTQVGTIVVGNSSANYGSVAPGLYVVDSSWLAAAWVLPVINGTQQPLQSVYQIVSGSVAPYPIDLGGSNEQVYLELYGTGMRNAHKVTCTVGNLNVPVLFAGAAPGYAGEDQINIGPLPPALAGRGAVNIVVIADGKAANIVNVTIK